MLALRRQRLSPQPPVVQLAGQLEALVDHAVGGLVVAGTAQDAPGHALEPAAVDALAVAERGKAPAGHLQALLQAPRPRQVQRHVAAEAAHLLGRAELLVAVQCLPPADDRRIEGSEALLAFARATAARPASSGSLAVIVGGRQR